MKSMLKKTIVTTSLIAFTMINAYADVKIDGKSMTSDKITRIANGEQVVITKQAMQNALKAHEVLMGAATSGHKIYGLTVGVGLNKDRKMINADGNLTQEVIDASTAFNRGLIYAHCGGVGEDIPIKETRAILAARLGNIMYGGTGVQEKVINKYVEFLNKDIIPVLPSKGSIGAADIVILGHVGLAMLGEGEVYYKGKKMPTEKAFKLAGVKKIELFAKDALSIVSSNAYSGGLAGLAVEEMKHLSKMSKYVYAVSLEGVNGNVVPMHEEARKLRPYPGFANASEKIRDILEGSYLWDKHPERPLQDALSYRSAPHIFGTFDDQLKRLDQLMKIHWNSSDDNPGIVVDAQKPKNLTAYEDTKIYVTKEGKKGAVIPVASFDVLQWVIAFEGNSVILAHLSLGSSQRINKLDNPMFTKLTRFLGTDKTIHAFGAMQKTPTSLTAKNIALANPVSLYTAPVAGEIEDIATNAPDVVKKTREQIENLYSIFAIELVHAAQAIDLRLQKNPNLKLGEKSEEFYKDFRKVVKFLDVDRPLTQDFKNATEFLKNYKFN